MLILNFFLQRYIVPAKRSRVRPSHPSVDVVFEKASVVESFGSLCLVSVSGNARVEPVESLH